MTSTEPVWILGGPTASGKSALAIRLAEKVDGVIVNAAPKETRLNEAGEFEVGTADVTYFESLTQEQLLAAIPVRSERDRFSNEVRGLRIQKPSDDPIASARLMRIEREQAGT